MRRKLGVAVVTVVAALAIGAGPASADPPFEFVCVDEATGEVLFAMGSPGGVKWAYNVQQCILEKGATHPAPEIKK